MIEYQFIWKKESRFKQCTGYSRKKFLKLLPLFTRNYHRIRQQTAFGKKRLRLPGGGAKPKRFDSPPRLLFYVLFYLRIYPTFRFAEILFHLECSNLHYWFHLGIKALELTVRAEIPIPARTEKVRDLKELFKRVPSLKEHIIDATEQPINRPKFDQKRYYSGKKKMHTKKKQIVITPDKKIISISRTVEGKKHDKKLADEDMYWIHAPPNTRCLSDLGYEGLDISSSLKTVQPYKKAPKCELNSYQKEQNKTISSLRVRVEHVIGSLKVFKIFSDRVRYRLPIDNYINNTIAGLYNFNLR
ncbi:MAG: transposase family protein [Patescibacteria group bacterium]|nr:transposase [Patescibacteria group bacterium]